MAGADGFSKYYVDIFGLLFLHVCPSKILSAALREHLVYNPRLSASSCVISFDYMRAVAMIAGPDFLGLLRNFTLLSTILAI